jgi:hypothetical protein
MSFRIRTMEMRHNDPTFRGVTLPPHPSAGDGKKTVIIHGKKVTHSSPRDRWPGAELWGVTRCNVVFWHESLANWSRWFDIHPVQSAPHHRGILAKRPEAWAWYRKQDTTRPIYLLEPHPDVPASVAFPRQWVQDTLKTSRFTVSVDWMIGLALCEGFERIVLNGIGTRFEADYQFAHQGILYWIGRAQGAGVDVVIEGPSCYAEPALVYGYEAGAPEWQKQAVGA